MTLDCNKCSQCDKYGLPGVQYEPPNEWVNRLKEIAQSNAPTHYSNAKFEYRCPDPPGEDETRAELVYLMTLKREVRDLQCWRIWFERDSFALSLEYALGLDRKQAPRTWDLIGDMLTVSQFWILKQKLEFNRVRPYQLERRLTPPFCPGHPAYPSGHAGQAHTIAIALGEAAACFPERVEYFRNVAMEIGFRREVAGVHYPSDSKAGRDLAEALIRALRADPEGLYVASVRAAKAELDTIWGCPKKALEACSKE